MQSVPESFSLLFLPTQTFPLLQHGASPQIENIQDKPDPLGAFHGSQFFQDIFTCSTTGSSMVYSVDICSSEGPLHGLQRDNLLHYYLLHRLQENLCCSTWTVPLLPSSLALVSLQLFFLTFFFFFSSLPDSIFALSKICFHRGSNSFIDELRCVLQWICVGNS